MIVTLQRIVEREGTYGVLSLDGHPRFVTLEPPWKNNEQNVSCIPTGRYKCRRFQSSRFGPTWKLIDVPGRSDVEFHFGSFVRNTEGCILVGLGFGVEFVGISSTRVAMNRFMQLTDDVEELELVVTGLNDATHIAGGVN